MVRKGVIMRMKKINRKAGRPKRFRRKAGLPSGLLAKEKKIATLNKKAKEQNRSVTVLRRLVGGTIMAAVVMYLVPELRQDIFSTIKWLNDEWRR
jgi:hypothetical protein